MYRRAFLAVASCAAVASRFAYADDLGAKRRVAVFGHSG